MHKLRMLQAIQVLQDMNVIQVTISMQADHLITFFQVIKLMLVKQKGDGGHIHIILIYQSIQKKDTK